MNKIGFLKTFREQVRRYLALEFRHVYIFGTAGEGYAVDHSRFRQFANLLGGDAGRSHCAAGRR